MEAGLLLGRESVSDGAGGYSYAVGDGAKILLCQRANITHDKGIVDFLNLYEEAVKIDPRSPQAMIDLCRTGGETGRCSGRSGRRVAGWRMKPPVVPHITIPQSQRATSNNHRSESHR